MASRQLSWGISLGRGDRVRPRSVLARTPNRRKEFQGYEFVYHKADMACCTAHAKGVKEDRQVQMRTSGMGEEVNVVKRDQRRLDQN